MERNVKVSKAVLKRLPGYLAYLKSLHRFLPRMERRLDGRAYADPRLAESEG